MKLFYAILIFLLSSTVLMAQATAEVLPNSLIEQTNVRVPASFPRGTKAMIIYINSQLKYPPKAKAQKRGGTVRVSFTVQTDGSLVNIRTEAPETDLKQEAIRVVASMPKWIPAEKDDVKVESLFLMTIKFSPGE